MDDENGDGKLLYDAAAAAKSLSISTRSLFRLIAAGKLDVVRIPGARGARISREELLRFATERR